MLMMLWIYIKFLTKMITIEFFTLMKNGNFDNYPRIPKKLPTRLALLAKGSNLWAL